MAWLLDQFIMQAKSAINDVGLVARNLLMNAQNVSIYIIFAAGSTAGTVLIESSHDPEYSGTWSTVATINWAAASRVHMAAIVGPHKALRVRISGTITNGSIDAYAVAN